MIAKNATKKWHQLANCEPLLITNNGEEEGTTCTKMDVQCGHQNIYMARKLEYATWRVEGRVQEAIEGGVPSSLVGKKRWQICEYYWHFIPQVKCIAWGKNVCMYICTNRMREYLPYGCLMLIWCRWIPLSKVQSTEAAKSFEPKEVGKDCCMVSTVLPRMS